MNGKTETTPKPSDGKQVIHMMDSAIRMSLFAIFLLLLGVTISLLLLDWRPVIYGLAGFVGVFAVLVLIETMRR
ncbi:MAG: hypothetical protein ABFE01_07670 [Phycisphaerales bacterium]